MSQEAAKSTLTLWQAGSAQRGALTGSFVLSSDSLKDKLKLRMKKITDRLPQLMTPLNAIKNGNTPTSN